MTHQQIPIGFPLVGEGGMHRARREHVRKQIEADYLTRKRLYGGE